MDFINYTYHFSPKVFILCTRRLSPFTYLLHNGFQSRRSGSFHSFNRNRTADTFVGWHDLYRKIIFTLQINPLIRIIKIWQSMIICNGVQFLKQTLCSVVWLTCHLRNLIETLTKRIIPFHICFFFIRIACNPYVCVLNIYIAKDVNCFVKKMNVQLIIYCESREEAKTKYFQKFMVK